ncbi:hypothetical protein TRFO_21600 [Tritrichomonas foetus]|uniref:C2 domain-containing protein n=1 Tax=Tritrichomonas foetus TaxID=1144522 RepID=A0A1J4KF34_9EUKA|nr:hypothetical protein TRFO_21600 [Tritrichomonas foetus]|eukprot:OHT09544.1 hypothetical protein TRFO_21600 [Tritrichomonas foetus]
MAENPEEMADVLAQHAEHAESQKVKKLKVYQTTYKINVRKISCKRLYNPNSDQTINPYVVFQVQGADARALTPAHAKTRGPVYTEELQLDGYCVGSDLLKVTVFTAKGEEPSPEDRCIAYAQIPICDLELGSIVSHTFKFFKSRDGKPLRDKRSKEGSAGTMTCEFHIADLGSISWEERKWGTTYYRAWIHFIKAENVPLINKNQPSPYLFTRIKPASNVQEQKTSTCIETTNPVWNELHCYMADDYAHQIVKLTLRTDVDGKPVDLATASFQLAQARPNEITTHNLSMNSGVGNPDEKGCIVRFRCQLLEKNKIPFDGSVAFKHDLFNVEVNVIEGKEITANPGDKPLCVLNIDKNIKKTRESNQPTEPQWDHRILFSRVEQRRYLELKVQDKHHRFGNVRLHLTRFPLNQETDNWYALHDAASGQVHLRIRLTRCDNDEIYDDDPEHHCHFEWQEINSDYSTDFTGYDSCSSSLSSTIHSSSERFHYEPRHAVDDYEDKPIRNQTVDGVLSNLLNVFQGQNAKSVYARISLHGKGHEKKKYNVETEPTEQFGDIELNKEFNFPRVKKGDSIRVTILEKFEEGDDVVVGFAEVPAKELGDETNVEISVSAPKNQKKALAKKFEGAEELGRVKLSLKSKVTFQ